MRGDDAAHDDVESDALLAVWRAWSRDHDLSKRDLWDAAYRGAVDGLRRYTGYRRKYKASQARSVSLDELTDWERAALEGKLWRDGHVEPSLPALLARHPPKTQRDRDIIAAYIDGEHMVSIGARYGVTESRVCQIVKKWTDRLQPRL